MGSIVVQLRPNSGGAADESAIPVAVAEAARHLRLSLAPQFAGLRDPELSRYFIAETPPGADAEAAAAALRALGEVDAAYVQPEASLPALD